MRLVTKKPEGASERDRFSREGWALLPLRAFLGSTFVYAGLQKLMDPQFFDPTASGSIEQQLTRFAMQSPLRWLLTEVAIPHGAFFGGLIAFGELWIGLATLLGLFTRLAGGLGALLNTLLWLTATWNVQPYFLGSDSIYAVAWLTLALAGSGVYSLDRWLAAQRSQAHSAPSATSKAAQMDRRALLREALAGGLVLASGAVLGVLGHLLAHPQGQRSPAPSSGGVAVGKTSQVAVRGALTFTFPSSDDPGIVVRLSETEYVAYDATCTHEGCPVDYDAEEEQFVCPCHGAIFDPAHHGLVLAGPANRPLMQVALRIDSSGTIYIIDG